MVYSIFDRIAIKRSKRGAQNKTLQQSPNDVELGVRKVKPPDITACTLSRVVHGHQGEKALIKHDIEIQSFIEKMNSLIKKDGNWRRYCYRFLTKSSLQVLKKLKRESAVLRNLISSDKSIFHFISDMINARMISAKQHSKSKQSHFLKIRFDNKGIEQVNIQSLLHKVNDAVPTSFTNPTPPTVIFTRTPSIGSKIFNYKNVVSGSSGKRIA